MDAADGGDATKAIKEALLDEGKRVTRDAMTVWEAEAVKRLHEAAGGRSGIDAQRDRRGALEGRKDNNLHKLANAITAIVWDDQERAWTFSVMHPAAAHHEWGAQPHEIQARMAQALVFEWPDAPEEVREEFEETFPTVFFDNIEHPGVPAIGYLRYGRSQASRRLADAGIEAEEFGLRGDA